MNEFFRMHKAPFRTEEGGGRTLFWGHLVYEMRHVLRRLESMEVFLCENRSQNQDRARSIVSHRDSIGQRTAEAAARATAQPMAATFLS